MLINVTYNKQTGEIVVCNDVKDIIVELGQSSIEDTEQQLYFEIALDTSQYELVPEYMIEEEEIIEESEE
jgi:hypothetical protein